jgi:glycosyltransferase involved in cell wall biosynthesis
MRSTGPASTSSSGACASSRAERLRLTPPVRILYLADVRFPIERANGIQTFETCWALAERGHDVTLLVRRDTMSPARDPFAFYGRPVLPQLEIRQVASVPGLARRASYLARVLAAASSRRADVIFTRDLGVASLILRAGRRWRAPLVYESHGYAPTVSRTLPDLIGTARPPSAAKLRRLYRREQLVWRRADGYITITALLAEELREYFGARAHVAVVPDGVRLDAPCVYEPAPAHRRPLIVYAGHLYPWKGADVLIDAMTYLPACDARIVGGHPAESDLERLRERAVTLGLDHRIHFTGLVPPAAVRRELLDASVLVLPNTDTGISQRYTSPLKLFEYLAAGRPVVASDLPAFREVVEHGRTAWLVAPGDATALAAGISRVIADPTLAQDLARAAFAAAQRYTWTARAERIDTLLRQIHP